MSTKITISDVYPLLPAQRGFLVDSLAGEGESYRQQVCVQLNVPLANLKQNIEKLVANNRILRTVFDWSEGEPLQVVIEGLRPCINTYQLPDDGMLSDLLNKELNSLAHVGDAPPVRFAIIKDIDRLYLAVTYHHILLDGPSINNMLEQIVTSHFVPETTPNIYSEWLKQNIAEQEVEYWNKLSANITSEYGVLGWGTDINHFDKYQKELGQRFYEDVLRLCKELSVSPAICLQSLWSMWATTYFNKSELLYGLVTSTRVPNLTDTALGPYIATIPSLASDHFTNLTRTANYVNESFYDVSEAKHIPLGDIAKKVSPLLINFQAILTITTQPVQDNAKYKIISTHENTGYNLSVDIEISDTICITFSGTLNELKGALESFTRFCRKQVRNNEKIVIDEHHKSILSSTKNIPLSKIEPRDIALELSNVLNIPETHIKQSYSFLDLGGDSISALRFKTILRKRGFDISIGDIIQSSSITELMTKVYKYKNEDSVSQENDSDLIKTAEKLLAKKVTAVTKMPEATKIIIDDYSRDFGQEYHEQTAFRLKGSFDHQKFARALWLLGEKYSVFRTFYLNELAGYQVETANPRISFKTKAQTEDTFREFVKNVSQDEWSVPFDLEDGPLFRTVVESKTRENEWYLFISFSALITDGWSFAFMLEKLFTIYEEMFYSDDAASDKDNAIKMAVLSEPQVVEHSPGIIGKDYCIDNKVSKLIVAKSQEDKITTSELLLSVVSRALKNDSYSKIKVLENGRFDAESLIAVGPFSYLSELKLKDTGTKNAYYVYENYPRDSENRLKKGEIKYFDELENWRRDLLPPTCHIGVLLDEINSDKIDVRIIVRNTTTTKYCDFYWNLLTRELNKI